MKIIRSDYIYIVPNGDYETNYLTSLLNKKLIYENPKFFVKRYKNNFISKEPRFVQTFSETRVKSEFAYKISRGNEEIIKNLKDNIQGISFIDERASYKIKCNSTAKPRDKEQEKAIEAIKNFNFNYGILNSPPGSGKTFMASQLITHFKERTLILVDMNLLIEQFIDSLLAFTDIKEEEIGLIRGTTLDYDLDKKVIIATMQTLNKKPDIMKKLSNNIGFLIQDECQIASCDTIRNIFKEFKPKYQLGLSGTPFRDDGMDFLIREMIGPIIYTTDKQHMIKEGNLIVPILRPIFLKDDIMFKEYISKGETEMEFRDVVEHYYNNPKTITKISKLITKLFDEHSQLVICKEKELVYKYHREIISQKFPNLIKKYEKMKETRIKYLEKELLKDNLSKTKKSEIEKEIRKINKEEFHKNSLLKDNPEFESIKILTGDISRKERNQIIEDTNSGKIKVIITTSLLDKAISINRLDILHLLFSTREINNLIQREGRISRNFEGKTQAIVFDYIYDHYMSFFQFYNAKGTCRMSGHNLACKIPDTIKVLIKYLQKRFIEKDNNISDKEYEKIKHLYELDVNK